MYFAKGSILNLHNDGTTHNNLCIFGSVTKNLSYTIKRKLDGVQRIAYIDICGNGVITTVGLIRKSKVAMLALRSKSDAIWHSFGVNALGTHE